MSNITNNAIDKLFDGYRDIVNRFRVDLNIGYVGNFPAIGGYYLQWYGDAGLCLMKTTSVPHVKMLKAGQARFPYLDEVLKEIGKDKDVNLSQFKPLALSKLGNVLIALQQIFYTSGSTGCNYTAKLSDDHTTVGLTVSFGQLRSDKATQASGGKQMAYMVKFNQIFHGFSGNKSNFSDKVMERLNSLTAYREELVKFYDDSNDVFFKENEDYGLTPTYAMLETVKFYDCINKLFNSGSLITSYLKNDLYSVKREIDKVFKELTDSKQYEIRAFADKHLLRL